MDVPWKYKRVQGVVYVMCHYGMAVWGRGLHQELWYVVDGNVMNSALHGAKQVVVTSMVPKLKSPVISADGIVSEVIELIISVLSLSYFPISWSQ